MNRYLGFDYVGHGLVKVAYLLDFAEVPAYAEIEALDANHDGEVSPEEQQQYLDGRVGPLVEGLIIELDGVRAEPVIVARHVETPPGEGGLSTLRIAAELSVRAAVPVDAGDVALYVRDPSFADKPGWREITVVSGLPDATDPAQAATDAGAPHRSEARYVLHAPRETSPSTRRSAIVGASVITWVQALGAALLLSLGLLFRATLGRRSASS